MTERTTPPPTGAHRAQAAAAVGRALPGMPDFWPAPSNPMGVARRLDTERTGPDGRTLLSWRDSWWRHDGARWVETEVAALRSTVYKQLEDAQWLAPATARKDPEPRPWAPDKAKVSNVLDSWEAIAHLPAEVEMPGWVGGPGPAPADRIVACANGLLVVGAGRTLHPLTPRYFNATAVPFNYRPDAPTPARWLAFLYEQWPPADGRGSTEIEALQEFLGYVISGRTDLQKMLLLVGPPRSGKSTIARVLTALVGKGASANPTLGSLATNFGLAPLVGKPLAVISDARLGSKADGGTVVERLLSISGEDALTIDRKNRDAWTGRLPTRFVILSNELPRFGDASGAIARRFVLLSTTASFLGREDPGLTDALLAELPGILNWSLDGLDRLVARRRFTEPASSVEAMLQLEDLTSPVGAFVRECCVVGTGRVEVKALFAAWQQWALQNGYPAGSSLTFGRDLRAAVPALRIEQPRTPDGRRRDYVGVELAPGVVALPTGPTPVQFMVNGRPLHVVPPAPTSPGAAS